MLVQLTSTDLLCDPMGLCGAFALAIPADWTAEDTAAFEGRLKAAADRVTGLWAIDVPDDVDLASKTRALFSFTTSSHRRLYHQETGFPSPLPSLSSATSGFLPQPNTEHFCPSSVPADLGAREKQQLPLLHVHVSSFSDALAIGINLPHGALDGTGMGFVVRALDAELHGRGDWVVPHVEEINPVQATCEELVRDAKVEAEGEGKLPPILAGCSDSASPVAVARLVSSALWEAAWFRSTERRLFVRQAVLALVAKRVKAAVLAETDGKEFVSSADAVTAWLLKSFHADEADPSSYFWADPVFSFRPLLSTYTPSSSSSPRSFSLYPHNSVVPYIVPPGTPIPLSTLASTPAHCLALDLRRGLNNDRALPVLRGIWRKQASFKGPLVPTKDWPELPSLVRRVFPFETPHITRWSISNQTTLGLADIRFPGKDGDDLPLLSYYLLISSPLAVDHYVNWQDVPGAGIVKMEKEDEA
ncbi:hypothetical protein JCM6882_008020 [Rhodosporidiobolus microsporus]